MMELIIGDRNYEKVGQNDGDGVVCGEGVSFYLTNYGVRRSVVSSSSVILGRSPRAADDSLCLCAFSVN